MKYKKLTLSLILFISPAAIFSQPIRNELWGMTSSGGAYNDGVIFITDSVGNNQTVAYEFNGSSESGHKPMGTLMLHSNGKLYGMTSEGGSYGGGDPSMGVIFEYNPTTKLHTKIFDFNGFYWTNGANPSGELTELSDGTFYGMTGWGGGKYTGGGSLFKYDTLEGFTKTETFRSSNPLSAPHGSLIKSQNGMLYGMCSDVSHNPNILTELIPGVIYGNGGLFEYNPDSNKITRIIYFDKTNGSKPYGSLLQADNGLLYGLTSEGGTFNMGVLFEYNPITSQIIKKIDLNGGVGSNPRGTLIQANNGKLYGITSNGGVNKKGVLFQYDISSNSFKKEYDFDGINGSNPNAALIEYTKGKLYGMTPYGGLYNKGVLFEYDYLKKRFKKKLDFNGSNGSNPMGSLIALNTIEEITETMIYPNPSTNFINIVFPQLQSNVQIVLKDVFGKTVLSTSGSGRQLIIDRNDLSSGIYFIQITDDSGKTINKKIMVR